MFALEGEKGTKRSGICKRNQALSDLRSLHDIRGFALPLLSYTTPDASQAQEKGCWRGGGMNYVIINVAFVAWALCIRSAVINPIS
jgi:hypothetical protein